MEGSEPLQRFGATAMAMEEVELLCTGRASSVLDLALAWREKYPSQTQTGRGDVDGRRSTLPTLDLAPSLVEIMNTPCDRQFKFTYLVPYLAWSARLFNIHSYVEPNHLQWYQFLIGAVIALECVKVRPRLPAARLVCWYHQAYSHSPGLLLMSPQVLFPLSVSRGIPMSSEERLVDPRNKASIAPGGTAAEPGLDELAIAAP